MNRHLPILSAASLDPANEPGWDGNLPASMKRRDPRIWHMAFTAARRACETGGREPKSIITATALGALDETVRFFDGIFKDGFGSPRSFIASVHNSMAGKLAIEMKIGGPNLTLCDGHNSFASAVATASLLSPCDFPSLIVAVDESTGLLKRLLPHLNGACRRGLSGGWPDGAVAFLVDSPGKETLPFLVAVGPGYIGDSDPQKAVEEMGNLVPHEPKISLALSQTSDTFLKPAQTACDLFNSGEKGCRIIGSFSPSSRSAAAVALCV